MQSSSQIVTDDKPTANASDSLRPWRYINLLIIYLLFYRPDALPASNQQCQSTEGKSHYPAYVVYNRDQ